LPTSTLSPYTTLFRSFILPTPLQVAQDFGLELSRGDLLANAGVTLQEALGGFALAAVVAGMLGYAIAHLRPLEVLVAPFIAASQDRKSTRLNSSHLGI